MLDPAYFLGTGLDEGSRKVTKTRRDTLKFGRNRAVEMEYGRLGYVPAILTSWDYMIRPKRSVRLDFRIKHRKQRLLGADGGQSVEFGSDQGEPG